MGRSNYRASSGAEAGPDGAAVDSAAETATGPGVAAVAAGFGAVARAVVVVVTHGGSDSDAVGAFVHSPVGESHFVGCVVGYATAPVGGAPGTGAPAGCVDCATAPVGGAVGLGAPAGYAIGPVAAVAIDAPVDCATVPVDGAVGLGAPADCAIAPVAPAGPGVPEIVVAELAGPPLDAALHGAADFRVLISAVESDVVATQHPFAAWDELHVAPAFAVVFARGPDGHAERWRQHWCRLTQRSQSLRR